MDRIDAFVTLDLPAGAHLEKTPIGCRMANDGTFTHIEEQSIMGKAGFKDGDKVLKWRELLKTGEAGTD